MPLKSQADFSQREGKYAEELQFLYQRLFTVTNLIRAFEEYDLQRPKPSRLAITEKSA